jgi:hypothetical protein
MIGITVQLNGERQLMAHLDRLPDEIQDQLGLVVTELTKTLLTAVRAAEPLRTGALRAATRSSVDIGKNFIRGRVTIDPIPGRGRGHNVAAAALEYGVHSAFKVASHNMRLSHIYNRPGTGQTVLVNAYTRRVDITARRFLRDPFSAIRPFAEAQIKLALIKGLG